MVFIMAACCAFYLGPVVQSIISLTNSLVGKMFTVLESKSYSHLFSENISIYAVFNDQSFNDTLTNVIVSFEQLGPDG